MRAIAEVATAVTKGDLTRSITVEASGEVAELKDNINEMIRNLRGPPSRTPSRTGSRPTSRSSAACCRASATSTTVGRMMLSELAPLVDAQQGVFYMMDGDGRADSLTLLAAYAYDGKTATRQRSALGEGLVGQCARREAKHPDRRRAADIRADRARACSRPSPRNIIVLPVLFEGQVKAVIELAIARALQRIAPGVPRPAHRSIGIVLNTIEANMRTEGLLKQSQQLAAELQTQQNELQQTNEELQEKAQLLAEQNDEVERKNSEVEQARRALEEKANSSRSPRSTSPSSSPTCRTSCARRSTSLLILGQQLARQPRRQPDAASRSSSPAPSTAPAPTCST